VLAILLKKCVNENCTFFDSLLLDIILEPCNIFEARCHAKRFKI
jgi:hypothetical protein